MESKNKLAVGIVGPGQLADRWLVPSLKQLEQAQLWSVLGRDENRTRFFAEKHAAVSPLAVFTDLDAFLADPQLDAVIIASPDRLHAKQAIAAARAGKHIFLEKPMATSAAEAKAILDAVAAAGVKLVVGYHLRFHAGHRAVKEAIGFGRIGQLRHMRVCWTLNAGMSDWRATAEAGRWWSLGATGTHGLDLVRWLMLPECGSIVDLKSVISREVHKGPHDETAVVSLRMQSGATAEVVSSVVFAAPRTVEIFGSRGSIVCTGTLGPRGTGDITINGEKLEYAPVDPYAGELGNFLDSILGLTEIQVAGLDGAHNVALLEQAEAAGAATARATI